MSYCLSKDLINRFGQPEIIQLTDREQLGVINDEVISQAIADAGAEINSYLIAYPLPLLTVPANLKRIACDIARYYLYEDTVTTQVQLRYDQAIKYLALVAKGAISLGADTQGQTPVADTLIEATATPRIFGRTS